jgi:hypothetical protein
MRALSESVEETGVDIFFADDSTQKGAREGMGSVVGLGGVLVEEGALRPLSAAIDEVSAKFAVPAGEELKWSPKKDGWIYKNLHGEDRQSCYRQVLEAAARFNVRAIVICWDTGRTRLKGADAFEQCVTYLFERLTMHLAKRKTTALIIADRPGGGKAQEDQFLHNFVERVQQGTEYVVPDHVLLNVLTTPSHLVRQLQLADLVTGITTAMVCGQEQYAGPLMPFVVPLLIKNHANGIAAAGLKVFPNALVNLYHWVLKEDLLHKGGGAVSYRLPTPNFPFSQHPSKA